MMIPVIVVAAVVVVCAVGWAYKRYNVLRFFKIRKIPGPEPSFFSGNMFHLRANNSPKDNIEQWLNEYGNVFGYFLGDRPYIVINDIDVVKQILIKEFHKFSDRPKPQMKNLKPIVDSIMFMCGERWKNVRSILTPTFSSTKMKQMVEVMNVHTDILVEGLMEYAESGESFEIYEKVQALTVDVIAKCALAMEINSQKDNKEPFLLAVREFFASVYNVAVEATIMFPFLSPIMVFINNHLTAGKMTNMVVKNLNQVISARQVSENRNGIDLLQLLLDASEYNNDGVTKKKISLTKDEIIGNCHIALLAGYETTATSLAFTVYLLATHPEIQERVHDEVGPYLENNPHPPYELIQSWQYLDQVFQESLRIYPPVTGFLTRECQEDCTINGIHFEKGVNVEVPVWQIHHNPELWPEPYKFDPERFSPENRRSIHPAAFLPFGIGPRSCLGMRFAQLEAKLALAKLIWNYKITPCDKTEDPLKLTCNSVITFPANGVHIKVSPRY